MGGLCQFCRCPYVVRSQTSFHLHWRYVFDSPEYAFAPSSCTSGGLLIMPPSLTGFSQCWPVMPGPGSIGHIFGRGCRPTWFALIAKIGVAIGTIPRARQLWLRIC